MVPDMKKILITYGFHPCEISAFYLAPKVANRLKNRDADVALLRFPYRKTNLYVIIRTARGEEIPIMERIFDVGYPYFKEMELPEHDLHIDFHNSVLDHLDAAATRNKSIEDYTLGVNGGDIAFMSDHMDRDNSYALEIPAFWKPLPKWIQEAAGYDKEMVDFRRTKEYGLVSDTLVDKIAAAILRLSVPNFFNFFTPPLP